MEYQVGSLADMISKSGSKKTQNSMKKTLATKIKFEKVKEKKIPNGVNSSKKMRAHEQDDSPKKRIRFSEPIAIVSNVNKSTNIGQVKTQNLKNKKFTKHTYEEEQRTIFVGNVSKTNTKEDLRRIFAPYGYIETIRFRSLSVANPAMSKKVALIKKELHPHRSNMNAYIKFRDVESAHKAVAENGRVMNNHTLRVDLALNENNYNPKACIFVGNLKFLVEEEHLRKIFEDCGEILNVRIVRDKDTGMGKGIAFIEFKTPASVELALQLVGEDLLGRPMRISRSRVMVNKRLEKEKKKRARAEEREAIKQHLLEQRDLNRIKIKVSAKDKSKKTNAKQDRTPQKNKSIVALHSPKDGLNGMKVKMSAGDKNRKINAKEHGTPQKNKSIPAQHSPKVDLNVIKTKKPRGNKNKKRNAKQHGTPQKNKSIIAKHSPKGDLNEINVKTSAGDRNKKTNVIQHGAHQKNKSIRSEFQGEKTGLKKKTDLKKIKKKKKLNKVELKKKIMLSKLQITPLLKKSKPARQK